MEGKGLNASAFRDAEIYVRRAPRQINTEIRSILEKEFGWTFISNEKPDWTKLKKDLNNRIIHKSDDDSCWVVVPDRPATFGHILVISWRGCKNQDITDKGLFIDKRHMTDYIRTIHDLSFEMKSCLTSNGETNGKKCEKVYLVSECETEKLPFHFHLIPRFEGEKNGNLFLFKKELEEARWIFKDEQEGEKIQDGHLRISKAEAILTHHKSLLHANNWVRSKGEREKNVEKITKWWYGHSIN